MTGTSTVKIEEKDKQKLEKLQALITIKVGARRKLTQQELLSVLINKALAKSDEFVNEVFKETVPASDKEFKRLLSLSEDWGVRTRWQDMDQVLY